MQYNNLPEACTVHLAIAPYGVHGPLLCRLLEPKAPSSFQVLLVVVLSRIKLFSRQDLGHDLTVQTPLSLLQGQPGSGLLLGGVKEDARSVLGPVVVALQRTGRKKKNPRICAMGVSKMCVERFRWARCLNRPESAGHGSLTTKQELRTTLYCTTMQ